VLIGSVADGLFDQGSVKHQAGWSKIRSWWQKVASALSDSVKPISRLRRIWMGGAEAGGSISETRFDNVAGSAGGAGFSGGWALKQGSKALKILCRTTCGTHSKDAFKGN